MLFYQEHTALINQEIIENLNHHLNQHPYLHYHYKWQNNSIILDITLNILLNH